MREGMFLYFSHAINLVQYHNYKHLLYSINHTKAYLQYIYYSQNNSPQTVHMLYYTDKKHLDCKTDHIVRYNCLQEKRKYGFEEIKLFFHILFCRINCMRRRVQVSCTPKKINATFHQICWQLH